ncbi:alpha/beta hydrolase fold domain-containing protein [uncultured Clostridium sp.]|uniref:alpha/beta hydrolase fold domain-containing protein n=1 Tax=uncultured Clostridium sp. TaxID=59620 RepID=UPI002582FE85|nr:alpha/beta hydrolase fold domain-containing protein [uncultured Clostridium sp.]
MIEETNIIFNSKDNITLNMTLYKSRKDRKNVTILYFHGGGLLYGVRDDLPKIYVNQFLDAGYDLLLLDYPLAPESNIDTILNSSLDEIQYFLDNYNILFNLSSNDFILFGRSAGAYLSLMMCNMLINNNKKMPLALISLYGYSRLDEVEFNTPNKYYLKLPKVSYENFSNIISSHPITYGPMSERFSLYIKVRQDGNWTKVLLNEDSLEDLSKYSINDDNLRKFPPTFLAAATSDPDVPYRISKKLSKTIPNSKLITIYDEVHDFDRDTNNNSGIDTYNKIINWLHTEIIK